MKTITLRSIFILLLIFMATATIKAQLDPEGKTYIANIASTCKMMQGGGCSIDDYCSMSFSKNDVSVFYYTKVNCSPKSREKNYDRKPSEKKVYIWSVTNNTIQIKDFNDYGNFTIEETKLIGKKNADTPLEFLKQK